MAHNGPPGKGIKLGFSQSADWTEVADLPFTGDCPDLPELPGSAKWLPQVIQWYTTVRAMPHCVLWSPSDWLFAIETAYVRQAFWLEFCVGDVRSTMATELRRRDDQLGTTAEARRKLRIRYVDPSLLGAAGDEQDEQPAASSGGGTVTDLAARRQRLAG